MWGITRQVRKREREGERERDQMTLAQIYQVWFRIGQGPSLSLLQSSLGQWAQCTYSIGQHNYSGSDPVEWRKRVVFYAFQ